MDERSRTDRASHLSMRGGRGRRALGLLLVVAALAVLRAPELVLGPFTDGGGPSATTPDGAPATPGTSGDADGPPDGDGTAAAGPTSSAAPATPPAEGSSAGLPSTGSTGRPTVVAQTRGGWRSEAGAGEAAALAVQAAHRWPDPDGAVGAVEGQARPGRVVTVEAVERPGGRHAVVTLLVTTAGRLGRFAVPVRFGDDGPVLAGPAWPLPAPALTTAPISGEATGDTVLLAAARRALGAAGIDGARMTALEVTDGWPFIARLDDGGAAWLRWHLDRFVVAGLPLARAGEAVPRITHTDDDTTRMGDEDE